MKREQYHIPDKIYSTKELQKESLVAFMKCLMYIPVNSERLGQGFRYIDFRSWHKPKYISFDNACKLHNYRIVRLRKKLSEALALSDHTIDFYTGQLQYAWRNKMKTRIKTTTYESGKVTYTPQVWRDKKFLWWDLSCWVDLRNEEYLTGGGNIGYHCSPRDTIEEAQRDIDIYIESVQDKIVVSETFERYP